MTDLEKFIELYKSFGIELKAVQYGDNWCVELGDEEQKEKHPDKFEGYYGFYSAVYFSLDGKFLNQEFWE